jgi:hypothetical protein
MMKDSHQPIAFMELMKITTQAPSSATRANTSHAVWRRLLVDLLAGASPLLHPRDAYAGDWELARNLLDLTRRTKRPARGSLHENAHGWR